MICTFIGAAGFVESKNGKNPLVEAAQEIDIFAGTSKRQRELDEIRGEKVADDWHDDPRLQLVQADPEAGVEASNPSGSYDAFMKMFGGPQLQAVPDLPEGGEES